MSNPLANAAFPGPWFRPRIFLVGLALGFCACILMAHYVAQQNYHRTFTRFHPTISPEAQYYPTVDEMCSIVRARCRPDQILVIVGGNSILYGVGQPADRMWTVALQRKLGDRYAVINLAFRGALATDGGAVIAEVLRQEYPRQIYIANMAPLGGLDPLGLDVYQFILWEAYYRGLLEDFPAREEAVKIHWQVVNSRAKRLAFVGTQYADTVLHYRDLWNWVGYNYIFTVKSYYTPTWPKVIWPRKRLPDNEGDMGKEPFYSPSRFAKKNESAEMAITRGFTKTFYDKNADGDWMLIPSVRAGFLTKAKAGFPDSLKKRTLLLVSRNSPYYRGKLTMSEQRRDDMGYRDTVTLLESVGYEVMEYGKDFANEDFGDRTHLTVSGGEKLAMVVAQKVKAMAQRQGYSK